MNPIYLFIIVLVFILIINKIKIYKIENYQIYEIIVGGILIVILFGIFGSILTTDLSMVKKSLIIGSFYMIWYYISRKITNIINTDKNGVLRY